MERNDNKAKDNNKIRKLAGSIGKIGRCKLKHTEKVVPKVCTCRICNTKITNFNYQNHFKNSHNMSKEEYFSNNQDQLEYKTKNYVYVNNTIIPKGMINKKGYKDLSLTQAKFLILVKSLNLQPKLAILEDLMFKNAHLEIKSAYKLFEKYKDILEYIEPLGKKVGESEEYLTIRYGKTLAKQMLEEKSNTVKGENNPGYQHNGKFSKWSKKFIHGYNKEAHNEAKQNHSQWVKSNTDKNHFHIDYWIKEANGNEKLAEELYINSQTKNLKWFVNKYGKEEGNRRHKEKIKKWIKTLDEKSPEEKERINKLRLKGAMNNRSRSKSGNLFFSKIAEVIPEISYGDNEKIVRVENNKFVRPDCLLGKKIIEYYGDYWHANPKFYHDENIKLRTRKVKDIRDRDDQRIKKLKKKGYEVMIIWESDYNANKQKVIKECLEFLQSD